MRERALPENSRVTVEKIEVDRGHRLRDGHEHAQTVNTKRGPQSKTQWPGRGSGNKPE
jgi:hypothetical protein